MRKPSLISKKKECFICQNPIVDVHHVFYGGKNRQVSDKYGCWIYLCKKHHNMSDKGVHFNKALDLKIKRIAQEAWEREYGSREDFIRTFGRNYL